MTDGMEPFVIWKKCRKLPVDVEYREVVPNNLGGGFFNTYRCEYIHTKEGLMEARPGIDYVIRGVDGELYPIKKDIFKKTYEAIP